MVHVPLQLEVVPLISVPFLFVFKYRALIVTDVAFVVLSGTVIQPDAAVASLAF